MKIQLVSCARQRSLGNQKTSKHSKLYTSPKNARHRLVSAHVWETQMAPCGAMGNQGFPKKLGLAQAGWMASYCMEQPFLKIWMTGGTHLHRKFTHQVMVDLSSSLCQPRGYPAPLRTLQGWNPRSETEKRKPQRLEYVVPTFALF